MSNCNNCPSKDSCSKPAESCGIENNPLNNIKNVIGVMSGKGGVGKSTISYVIAKQLNKEGYRVGILDADITGPSIPRLAGIREERARMKNDLIQPVETKDGIKVISFNLLVDDESQPVLWRGPLISSAVKQFWLDTFWGDLDYLIIDMPPGTADVAITIMQSIPINGLVMVSVPQDMVSMIVAKAVNMAKKLDIKILGVIENMSYIICPCCENKIRLFNSENTDTMIEELDLELLGEIPMIEAVSNIPSKGYDDNDEALDNIFKPIVGNIRSLLK
ncbi:Mrp/NBP35 family ATP-binding protein [Paratissierella segnis]|uniref:Iron-sulfur cluster carrier protein n=1 Tax=Paratissierella segnis TaxID=2763679 RepID=A0A926ETW5_9FIRM|nr:Mrp/NBP35 family ATP-binding protein [Paratissierella segnis]MBC8587402.1 Mrp/NBP35 family ATP-binding protein [Paratissierella segnis]